MLPGHPNSSSKLHPFSDRFYPSWKSTFLESRCKLLAFLFFQSSNRPHIHVLLRYQTFAEGLICYHLRLSVIFPYHQPAVNSDCRLDSISSSAFSIHSKIKALSRSVGASPLISIVKRMDLSPNFLSRSTVPSSLKLDSSFNGMSLQKSSVRMKNWTSTYFNPLSCELGILGRRYSLEMPVRRI